MSPRPAFASGPWRTSSYSNGNGDCVEVAFAGWHASSHSNSNGNCVEVGSVDDRVGVRDSKDRGGPVLDLPAAGWAAFLTGLRRTGH